LKTAVRRQLFLDLFKPDLDGLKSLVSALHSMLNPGESAGALIHGRILPGEMFARFDNMCVEILFEPVRLVTQAVSAIWLKLLAHLLELAAVPLGPRAAIVAGITAIAARIIVLRSSMIQ
jgi:hypothetical protein